MPAGRREHETPITFRRRWIVERATELRGIGWGPAASEDRADAEFRVMLNTDGPAPPPQIPVVGNVERGDWADPLGIIQAPRWALNNIGDEEPEEDAPELTMTVSEISRRIKLSEFKHEYEGLEEIQRRLNGTLIIVNGEPFIVLNVSPGRGDFSLTLQDAEGKSHKTAFGKIKDLRSLPPGYISFNEPKFSGTYWFSRLPGRRTMQGVSHQSFTLKALGHLNSDTTCNLSTLAKGVKKRVQNRWEPQIGEYMARGLIPGIMFNINTAAFYKEGKVLAEYKGRELGEINGDKIKLDEDDFNVPWIIKDLTEANLRI